MGNKKTELQGVGDDKCDDSDGYRWCFIVCTPWIGLHYFFRQLISYTNIIIAFDQSNMLQIKRAYNLGPALKMRGVSEV